LHVVSAYRVLTDLALAGSAAAAVPVPAWVADEIQTQVGEMLNALGTAIEEQGVRCMTYACPQSAAEAIIQVAESQAADLIIVGSRGMQGARRLLGSVPNAVAHHAPCDVLVVHTC
jgi:nucleotide-binding universal stress UspA family protein